MKVLDLNVLLYAVNADGPRHARAHAWLEATLSTESSVAIPWTVILGFLRLATHPDVFQRPLTVEQAVGVVESWLERPSVVTLSPGTDHWTMLRDLLLEAGTAGNLTTDAHLAALAIEHGAELCSTDADFARFKTLRWINPL
jgi:toxin-antitoxin system PIN domain toxin